ncbi:MAG: DUF1116 domain-containing protein [Albidovulum sp.]|nr:DUF1116 domain-containing protein [Albidovulum sp.]
MTGDPIESLLRGPPKVINVGLAGFSRDLSEQGVESVHVDWSPPAQGDPIVAALLSKLDGSSKERIDAANSRALDQMLSSEPVLIDVIPASEAIPALEPRRILHAGPPLEWERMCGPMRGAIQGISVFEGWEANLSDAQKSAEQGLFSFYPNHHFDAVGPMTGITTLSQPVMVVENRKFGNRAYCAINEGLGKVLRFGGNDDEVLNRLRWIRDEFGPALGRALRNLGGLSLKGLVARGLSMGDEMHQRNAACSSLALRELAAALAETSSDSQALTRAFAFMAGNDQFFLNIAMAMGKSIADSARAIEGSSIVTAMSRNGTDFGIQVSGTGDSWFIAPVEMPEGLFFPGFTEEDANPDMGDSAIVETVGLGGFAMGAAPAVAGFVGAGAASDAGNYTLRMKDITAGGNPEWKIPSMDYIGVPTGIDIRAVVETAIAPTINTGIAHRRAGIGQVGAGIARAPLKCFSQALVDLARRLEAK